MRKVLFFIILWIFQLGVAFSQKKTAHVKNSSGQKPLEAILPGAYQFEEYVPLLKGKRVAIFANNTAMVANTHLVDTLKKLGVTIAKIFGPEHGFRGTANAGEKVDNYTDKESGINVISLYGKKRKPSPEDMADVDVLMFDIQDVGVRFYTYISSLQDYMESAIHYNKPLIVLDRPNPNGFYVDGPVLDTAFKSFIGMQPVPVVYGLTIGEYAKFLAGESLLDKKIAATGKINLTVIKCKNYTHKSRYVLPIKPSPNLPDAASIYWYPSTCFFEGTVLNEGRGTDKPFQIFGHPLLPRTLYAFTPVANAGSSTPKLKDQLCYGWNLSESQEPFLQKANNQLQLKYLLQAYKLFPEKDSFFIKPKKADLKVTDIFFNKLAGNAALMEQIIAGKTEQEIRASWQPKLMAFKKTRKKYLLYPDFDSL